MVQLCLWEPLVAEESVTELLAVPQLPLPEITDRARNLYRPSQIAEWINEHCMER
jgi:hypothetical protein